MFLDQICDQACDTSRLSWGYSLLSGTLTNPRYLQAMIVTNQVMAGHLGKDELAAVAISLTCALQLFVCFKSVEKQRGLRISHSCCGLLSLVSAGPCQYLSLVL